ncbi:MAG: polysaccharide biosynthesis protein, partial [Phycisphaerae bacterium]
MANLTDKTILITGGTGSFGQAMVDRLLKTDVKEIRIFSRDELKQELMRIEYKKPRPNFYIGDVRERDSNDNDAVVGALAKQM